MKKTPAELNVEKLEAWLAKQTDQDIKELNYRGSICRSVRCKQACHQRATKIFNDWERKKLTTKTNKLSQHPT